MAKEFMCRLSERLPQMQRVLEDDETWPELEPATPNCIYITSVVQHELSELSLTVSDYVEKYVQPALDDIVAQLHGYGSHFKFYIPEMPGSGHDASLQIYKGAAVRVRNEYNPRIAKQGPRFDFTFTVIS